MENIKKKYCCIITHRLSLDSALRRLPLKDPVLDDKGYITLFSTNNYKLLAEIDKGEKIDALIYKSDQEGKAFYEINNKSFEEEAKKVIRNSLNRLQVAFLGVRMQVEHTAKIRNDENFSVDILDYETGVKASFLTPIGGIYLGSGGELIRPDPHISCQQIYTVLKVEKDNLDEYIDRFISLEKLSNDPVLHLITLFSLYEYIKESQPSDKRLERAFTKHKKIESNFNLEEKFRNARHLVAHGFAGGKGIKHKENTTKILEEFLGFSPSGSYSFDRYNPSHINLINEVIGEAQTIIHNYFREELKTHH